MFIADYTLKLKEGKEIPLLFNTWAFKTYSARKGVEYEELAEGCSTKEDGTMGDTLKTKNFPDMLLMGAETFCKYNNLTFAYSDLDACNWMDELPWRTSKELQEILTIFVSKLLNIDLTAVKVEAPKKEVKKKVRS